MLCDGAGTVLESLGTKTMRKRKDDVLRGDPRARNTSLSYPLVHAGYGSVGDIDLGPPDFFVKFPMIGRGMESSTLR
jgi:hypothetical protein